MSPRRRNMISAGELPAIRDTWARVLGPLPERSPLETGIVSTEPMDGYSRHLLRYRTEEGAWTEAYYLAPDDATAPFPAMVVFHATTNDNILQPVGLASAPTRHFAAHLVRRGYAVICPKCFIYGYRNLTWQDACAELRRRHPGMAGMAKMLWDGIRAVDVLADWPEVDMSRIGAMGHSLGAKETLYLAAFDPRVRAAISSEGGVGLRMSNWDAPWYLGDAIPPEGSGVDHDQLLALVAPRAFLLVGGGDSDSETSRHFIESARNVYREFGREDALEFLLHAAGHDFPDAMRERAFAWLDRHLAPVP